MAARLRNPLIAAASRPPRVAPGVWLAALTDAGFSGIAVDFAPTPADAPSRIAFVRLAVDIAAEHPPESAVQALAFAAEHRATLELTLTSSSAHDRPSAPRGLPRAAAIVAPLARQAQAAGVSIALRPRDGAWMQRIDDVARVAMRVNRPNVGLTLSLPDWHAADGGPIDTRVKLALPRMLNLIVSEGDDATTDAARRVLRSGYAGPVTFEVMRECAVMEDVIAAMRGVLAMIT